MRTPIRCCRPRLPAVVALAAFAGLAAFALCAGAQAAPSDRVVTITAGGKPAIEIAVHGDSVRVSGAPGEPALLGERRGDKRKYRVEAGGAAVAEVKLKAELPGDDVAGFKLRTPDGKLLWRVKVGADKVKISADEEGARAWAISLKHADKLKVVDPDGKDAGAVKIHAGDRVTVEDPAGHLLFAAPPGPRSALFGVLLIDAMPARERWIVMAEILAAGS
jgi:hypothetical protein